MRLSDLFDDQKTDELDFIYYPKVLEILAQKRAKALESLAAIEQKIAKLRQVIFNTVIRESFADGKRIYKNKESVDSEVEHRLSSIKDYERLREIADKENRTAALCRTRHDFIRRQFHILETESLHTGARNFSQLKKDAANKNRSSNTES